MARIDRKRWHVLSPLLDELLDATAAEREERLAALRVEDHVRAAELAKLLAIKAQIDTEGFLEEGPLDAVAALVAGPGRRVGNYTLLHELGAGGMGTVWLARRTDGRFEGNAAVKLLSLALLGRAGIERFRREGSALARLSHPNIAHLIDAGAADGQPYLVLEYVEGEPLDTWCDRNALGVDARIRLFLQVLAAVGYAHSRLILHRDLKPSNILVTPAGQVKLLDFGIAKLLDDDVAARSELTRAGGRAMTPDFASPEQVQGTDVSTATDVYALGVLLFMLLTGAHPTARTGTGHVERLRAVVEAEPARLAAAAQAADAAVARARATTPHALQRALHGDLENVVAKALKKAPGERYATADALAADLQRVLAHQPVTARADSPAYRLAKFIRRNRLPLGAAALVLLAIGAGVAGIAWQAAEARRQGAEAAAQRDRAQALLGRNGAIVDFVGRMFTEPPLPGDAPAIRRLLERGEATIGREAHRPAAERAEMLLVLAGYYNELEDAQRATDLLARALALIDAGTDRSLKARIACELSANLYLLNRRAEGAQLLDAWTDAPGIDDESAAHCLSVRASNALNVSQPQEALDYAQRALARLRSSTLQLPETEAVLLGTVGFALHLAGRNDEADQHYRNAWQRVRDLGLGDAHGGRRILSDWANASYGSGNFAQGLALNEQLMRLEQALNTDGIALAPTLVNHAFGLEQLGRFDEALAGYALAGRAAERSSERVGNAIAWVGRASVYVQTSHPAQARQALQTAATLIREALPPTHPFNIRSHLVRGQIESANGRLDAAAAEFTAIIDALTASGVIHGVVTTAYRQRAEAALRQGDPARTLGDAQQALALARRVQGSAPASSYTGWAALTLGRVHAAARRAGEARAAYREAESNLRGALGDQHPGTRSARDLAQGE